MAALNAFKRIAPIPLAFFLTSLVLRLLLRRAPQSIHSALEQPLPVVTGWHDFGLLVWCCAFAGIIVAGVVYLRWLARLAATQEPVRANTTATVLACVAALAAALSFPMIFSSDVYAYAAYGWLAGHGIDPYAHARIAFGDPLLGAAIWQWSNPLPVCVYGPAFIWIAKIVVGLFAPFGATAVLFAMRAICALALLACAPLLAALFDDARRRRLAISGLLLNPVAIWCAAEGHNDTLLLAGVLFGLLVVKRFGHLAGAFVLMATSLIKASGVAAAVALAVFAWPDRSRFVRTILGIAGGALCVAILYKPFGATAATALLRHGHYAPQYSLQYLVMQAAAAASGRQVEAVALALSVALVCAGLLAYRGARLAFAGDVRGAAFLALALWLLIPNPYPWYAFWILPVAFLALEQGVSWAILAAGFTIFARYLPDMSSAAYWERNVAVTLFIVVTPWLVALWNPRAFARRRLAAAPSHALRG